MAPRPLTRTYTAETIATTDAICGSLIGPLLVAHPRLVARVAGWPRDRNLWVRRASAVGLIPMVRRGHELQTAYSVARTLHRDPNDLIQKADDRPDCTKGRLAIGHLITSLLYGVTPTDPMRLAAAAVLLGLVAFLASDIPVRHALRTDPAEAPRR